MRVIALFNLKPEVDPAAYETWARTRDIPGVRSLPSIDDFQIYRATGVLGGGAAPYQYIEIFDIVDMAGFRTDTAGNASQVVAREMLGFLAAPPIFITVETLD